MPYRHRREDDRTPRLGLHGADDARSSLRDGAPRCGSCPGAPPRTQELPAAPRARAAPGRRAPCGPVAVVPSWDTRRTSRPPSSTCRRSCARCPHHGRRATPGTRRGARCAPVGGAGPRRPFPRRRGAGRPVQRRPTPRASALRRRCRWSRRKGLLLEPRLDVSWAVAEVPTDPDGRRTEPAVPPGVQGGLRFLEVVGHLVRRPKGSGIHRVLLLVSVVRYTDDSGCPVLRGAHGIWQDVPVGDLGKVIGGNVARLREERGARQTDLAAVLRHLGLGSWTRDTVASFETGRREVAIEEL